MSGLSTVSVPSSMTWKKTTVFESMAFSNIAANSLGLVVWVLPEPCRRKVLPSMKSCHMQWGSPPFPACSIRLPGHTSPTSTQGRSLRPSMLATIMYARTAGVRLPETPLWHTLLATPSSAPKTAAKASGMQFPWSSQTSATTVELAIGNPCSKALR